MKIVIMAGGKGTRISSVRDDIPKPMIDILGKPVLQYQIEFFRDSGYRDIIVVVGHLGDCICDYFKDGYGFGVNIMYYYENRPLGTAGALKFLKEELRGDFLLVNGDIIFDIDLERFIKFHKNKKAIATIATHPNSHPYDSSLIDIDENSMVLKWTVKEENRGEVMDNRVNAGIHLLSDKIWEIIDEIDKEKIDLDRDILRKLTYNKLYAYDTPEYIHDMGTPERYKQVVEDVKNNIPKKKNLKNKQRAIFLDRDGTINKYKGFICKEEDIELIDGVSEAIRAINRSGYLAIIITNQPVIARGDCTDEELDKIHRKLKYLLGLDGAYVDDIFYCPHHPDKGFEGEIEELKIKCECRKPGIGLFKEAATEYNIDLDKSFMIGDSKIDVEAGKNAGCKSYLLNAVDKNLDEKYNTVADLFEAIALIYKENSI